MRVSGFHGYAPTARKGRLGFGQQVEDPAIVRSRLMHEFLGALQMGGTGVQAAFDSYVNTGHGDDERGRLQGNLAFNAAESGLGVEYDSFREKQCYPEKRQAFLAALRNSDAGFEEKNTAFQAAMPLTLTAEAKHERREDIEDAVLEAGLASEYSAFMSEVKTHEDEAVRQREVRLQPFVRKKVRRFLDTLDDPTSTLEHKKEAFMAIAFGNPSKEAMDERLKTLETSARRGDLALVYAAFLDELESELPPETVREWYNNARRKKSDL